MFFGRFFTRYITIFAVAAHFLSNDVISLEKVNEHKYLGLTAPEAFLGLYDALLVDLVVLFVCNFFDLLSQSWLLVPA